MSKITKDEILSWIKQTENNLKKYTNFDKFINFDKFLIEYNRLAKIELENTEELKNYFINALVKSIENNGCINSVEYDLEAYETKKEYAQGISVDFKTIISYDKDGDIDDIVYEFIY